MSNYLALATVTSAIQQLLRESVSERVPGAEVTTLRPDDLVKSGVQSGINVHLFHAPLNLLAWSGPVASRDSEALTAKRSESSLDLYYLISCFGKEEKHDPEKLIALATIALLKAPELTSDRIAKTIAGAAGAGLAGSDLSSQSERVRLEVRPLTTEELQRIWSLYGPGSYRLSILCVASVVTLSAGDAPVVAKAPATSTVASTVRIIECEPKRLPGITGTVLKVVADRPPANLVAVINDLPVPTERVDRTLIATFPRDIRAGLGRLYLGLTDGDGSIVPASDPTQLLIQPTVEAFSRSVIEEHQTTVAILARPVPDVDQTLQLVLSPKQTPNRGQSSSEVLCFPLPLRLWSGAGPVSESLRRAFLQNGHALPDDAVLVELGKEIRIRSAASKLPEYAIRRNSGGLYAYHGLTSDDPEGTVCFAFSPLAKGSYLARLRVDGVESPLTLENEKPVGPLIEVG